MVGVQTVHLVQHVREELVAPLEDTDGVQGLPTTGEHVIEGIPGKLLDPVLDHPVRNQNIPHRVLVVVGDAEEVCLVP